MVVCWCDVCSSTDRADGLTAVLFVQISQDGCWSAFPLRLTCGDVFSWFPLFSCSRSPGCFPPTGLKTSGDTDRLETSDSAAFTRFLKAFICPEEKSPLHSDRRRFHFMLPLHRSFWICFSNGTVLSLLDDSTCTQETLHAACLSARIKLQSTFLSDVVLIDTFA